MNEKAMADCNLLRMSLQKSEDQIKSLRHEKDYYVRQLECLRKELEASKQQQSCITINTHQDSVMNQSYIQDHKKAPSATLPQNMSKQVGAQVEMLQKEVKDLRFELTQKEENLGIKVETIRNLQDTIDSLKKHANFDMEKIKKEYFELKDDFHSKDQQIEELSFKCGEMMKA